jgi:hypothetical protein
MAKHDSEQNNRNFVYDLLYSMHYLTFSLPFLIALIGFYSWYARKFIKFPPRLREKKLAEVQIKLLKKVSLCLIFGSNVLILAHGTFENEFMRVLICIICGLFGFYSNHHYLNRLIVSATFILSHLFFLRLWPLIPSS